MHVKSMELKYPITGNLRRSVDRRRSQQSEMVANLKSTTACADCKKLYPPWVMDFDHLPGTVKLFDVNRSRTRSMEKVLVEIDKCEIVCSNCHRERTHIRQLDDPDFGKSRLKDRRTR